MTSRPNFNPIARPYRWLEYLTFGSLLERCRFHFLDRLSQHRRALILGDGDGRFTARLLASNPRILIDAVDSSSEMLRLLTQRVDRVGSDASQRLRTIHSDALTLIPETTYDLVITHFFLDCFTEAEIQALTEHLQTHLASGATWLISDFAYPETQPAAVISKAVTATLYVAFRLITGLRTRSLPDYTPILQQAGFTAGARKAFLGGLLITELWQLSPHPKGQPNPLVRPPTVEVPTL